MQMLSLGMVLVVGVLLSLPPSEDSSSSSSSSSSSATAKEFNLWYGVVPTLIAALLSLVAFLAEEGGFIFFDGPSRGAASRHALLRCCHRAERPEQSGT